MELRIEVDIDQLCDFNQLSEHLWVSATSTGFSEQYTQRHVISPGEQAAFGAKQTDNIQVGAINGTQTIITETINTQEKAEFPQPNHIHIITQLPIDN